MDPGTTPPFAVHMMFTFIQRTLGLVIYGTLIILGLVWGKRSGGFFAAGALIVFLFGTFFTARLVPALGLWVTGLPNLIGLVLLLAAVIFNVMRHRTSAEAGVR